MFGRSVGLIGLVLRVIVCRRVAPLVSSISNTTSTNGAILFIHQIPVLVGGPIVFRFSAPLLPVVIILIFF